MSERLKCSNPQCDYLVATNSEKMGSFCCKKCHMHFRGECRKLKHGGLCEKAEAPAELPRAPVVDPKEPMTQGQELPPKKNGKSGKKRNRSEGWEWNEPVAEEPAGIWSGMSQADQQNMLNRARRRMKKRAIAGHYTRRIRDASPVTDAESSLSSRKDGNERAGHSRSRSQRSRRSRKSVEHGRALGHGHTDLRDARPGNPMIPAESAHQLRTCPPRPRGSVGASMAASHRDTVSHDEHWLPRRDRTKSIDRSHPRQGGELVAVKQEQIESRLSPPRRRREDREWSRTRHGANRRLAPGQVFDAFRERSPWSPPLRRRRRARADSDSEYTIDSEESIVTSYTVSKEEVPAPPSTSRVSGAEGQPEASSLCLMKDVPRSEGKLEAMWQGSFEVGESSAQAAAPSKERKTGRGRGTSAPTSRRPARTRDRRPAPKKKQQASVESSGSYGSDYSYYSDSDSAHAKDKRASK